MKKYKISTVLIALFTLGMTTMSHAQFDDLYYNPDTDNSYSASNSSYDSDFEDEGYTYDDEEYDYDDDNQYDSDDRYDYYYTSRIRRFHRPYYGFSYFDPCYVDRGYYDPVFSPGVNVYIYSNPYSYNSYRNLRRWNRWNRWNSWNSWNNYGNYGYGNNFYTVNNYYGNNFGNGGFYGYGNGYSSFGGYGNVGGAYCGPSWSNPYGFTSTRSGASDTDVYYGSRRRGTGTAPSSSPRASRSITPNTARDVSRNNAPDRVTNTRGTVTDSKAKDASRRGNSSRYDVYDAGSSKTKGDSRRSSTLSQQESAKDYKPTRSKSKPNRSIYNGSSKRDSRSSSSRSSSRYDNRSKSSRSSSTRSKSNSSRRGSSTKSSRSSNRGSKWGGSSRSSNRGSSTRSSSRSSNRSSNRVSSPKRSSSSKSSSRSRSGGSKRGPRK